VLAASTFGMNREDIVIPEEPIVKVISVVDTFHDFGVPPLSTRDLRALLKPEIDDIMMRHVGIDVFESGPFEKRLHDWLVKRGIVEENEDETVSYDVIQEQKGLYGPSPALWKTLPRKELVLGRLEPVKTQLFANNPNANLSDLVMGVLQNNAYVIDRTLVNEPFYCHETSRILWGVPSEYDHLVPVAQKEQGLGACITNLTQNNESVVLRKKDGFLIELERVTSTTSPKHILTYERRDGQRGVIDLQLIMEKKGRGPSRKTLFKQCIKFARTMRGGAGKKRKADDAGLIDVSSLREFSITQTVEDILREQFGLAPPPYTPSDVYIRICFDFKRIMDFAQVVMAQNNGAVFVTHDRVPALLARVLKVPTILTRMMAAEGQEQDDNGGDERERVRRNKSVILYPANDVHLTPEEQQVIARSIMQTYVSRIRNWWRRQVNVKTWRLDAVNDALYATIAGGLHEWVGERAPKAQSGRLDNGDLKVFFRLACASMVYLKVVYTAMFMKHEKYINSIADDYASLQRFLQDFSVQSSWKIGDAKSILKWTELIQQDSDEFISESFIESCRLFLHEDTEVSWWTELKHLRGLMSIGITKTGRAPRVAAGYDVNNFKDLYLMVDSIKAHLHKLFAICKRKWIELAKLPKHPLDAFERKLASFSSQPKRGGAVMSRAPPVPQLLQQFEEKKISDRRAQRIRISGTKSSSAPRVMRIPRDAFTAQRKGSLFEDVVAAWNLSSNKTDIEIPRHIFYGLQFLLNMTPGELDNRRSSRTSGSKPRTSGVKLGATKPRTSGVKLGATNQS